MLSHERLQYGRIITDVRVNSEYARSQSIYFLVTCYLEVLWYNENS